MIKKLRKNNQKVKQVPVKDGTRVLKPGNYYIPALVFILSGLYFYPFGNYIFLYQENLSLFVFTCDFLKHFTSKPGGLLEYAGSFLTQFYFSKLYGTIILSAVFALTAIILIKINRKLSPGSSFSLLFAAVGSCSLILIQTNINYLIHNNLGILSAGLYFLFSISSEKKSARILILSLFPLFFYITGAYAWIFMGMYIIYHLLNKKVIYPFVLLIIAGLSLLISKEMLFFQTWSGLLYSPMPMKGFFIGPFILGLLFLFFAFYPLLIIIAGSIKINDNHGWFISLYSPLLAVFMTIIMLSKIYSKEVSGLFRLEKYFFAGDWNGVIRQQEKDQSGNPVAQYYYNTALAESGLLCERLFMAPQDYGSMSISIPWNSEIPMNKLFRGVYFYYSIGLINEAHRWAYESMVTQGYRPENIKLLIKTNLINGHYKIADKYIYVLKRTLHYRHLAKKFEAMLSNPELIESDPELGEKIRLKPKDDFILRIRNPRLNITSLLVSNPDNRKAFEYEMACLLLDKNMEGIVNNLKILENMNYSATPRYLEEAALFIRSNMELTLPELDRMRISKETESRFTRYIKYLMKISSTESRAVSEIPDELNHTFWHYLDIK